MSRRGTVLVVGLVVLGSLVLPVSAATVNPRFEVVVPEPVAVDPGGDRTFTVQLLNDADDADDTVKTARQVRATLGSAGTPVEVESGPQLVGTLEDGVPRPVTFRISAPLDAAPGTYDLPIEIAYEYDTRDRRATLSVPVEVSSVARFRVAAAETTAGIGSTGTLTLRIEHVGTEPADDATVVVESPDPDLAFGADSPRAESFLGRWQPGDTKEATFRLRVAESAIRRNYSIRTTVEYEDADGVARSVRLAAGVRPGTEQSFGLEAVSGSLAIGSTGSIGATVVNTGESAARDAVVVLRAEGSGLEPRAVEYPLGNLGPGERATVEFTVDVPDTAAPGPRRVVFSVRYETPDGELDEYGPLGGSVAVGPRDSTFSIEPVRTGLEVDSTGRVTIAVTNELASAVTDAAVTVTVVPPLETADTMAYAGTVSPGQTVTLEFELEATEDAIAKTYPVQVDIAYRDAAGTLKESGPYRVGVPVSQPAEEDLPLAPIAVVVLALVGAGVWWYRRR